MSFNCFNILATSDAELTHSSMIQYFLKDHPELAKKLFSHFNSPITNVELEKTHTVKKYKGKKRRFHIDIEVYGENEKELLVVENKFKSFPTIEQLEDYDYLFSSENKKPVCYLVCFDRVGVPFQKDSQVKTKNFIWHILTYSEIKEAIESYIKDKEKLDPEEKTFLQHYTKYLKRYYNKYEDIFKNYEIAFQTEKKFTGKSKRELDQENRFWQRLMLYYVANDFATRRKTNNESDASYGGSTTPLLHICPKGWELDYLHPDIKRKKTNPVQGRDDFITFCIQAQGKSISLGIVELEKDRSKETLEKILNFSEEILKYLTGKSDKNTSSRYKGYLKNQKTNYVYLYKCRLDTNVPASDICNQVWNFYLEADKILQEVKSKIK